MSGQNAMSKDNTVASNTRRYRGVSGEERKEERRHRLIEAGLAVFGLAGYHGATVKAICVQAGLTERYFYESFANSEDLLCAVYEQHMALQQERILGAVMAAPREPGAMIEAGLRAFFELARENPAGSRVQFVEVLGVSPRVDRLYRQAIENFAQMLRQLNLQLSQSEAVPARDEETLSIGLVGASVGIASRWLLSDFTQPLESMLATTMTIFTGVWQPRAAEH
ncbi:MAG: TetR/AcrR family transcriptional regulator [bacterium]|nr:TetR/AcrR family transcriptional regulator [bacterium]